MEPASDEKLLNLLARAKAKVAAMSEPERNEMLKAQKQSWLRAMQPCEHGIGDWEECGQCREGYGG